MLCLPIGLGMIRCGRIYGSSKKCIEVLHKIRHELHSSIANDLPRYPIVSPDCCGTSIYL